MIPLVELRRIAEAAKEWKADGYVDLTACAYVLDALPALLDQLERAREALTWIGLFAKMRSEDRAPTFARVNRGALRTISERALTAIQGDQQ